MKVISQQGEEYEVFELECQGCKLYGQPKNIKENKVILGEFSSLKRTIEVMAEMYCLSNEDKNNVYVIPKE